MFNLMFIQRCTVIFSQFSAKLSFISSCVLIFTILLLSIIVRPFGKVYSKSYQPINF